MREVKRLRVFGIDFDIDESPNGYLVYAHDFDAQAAELAEARELLREARYFCQQAPSVLPRIDAFLSK